jgi:hypothetical protein
VYESFRKESAADGQSHGLLAGEVEPGDAEPGEDQREAAGDDNSIRDADAPSVTDLGQNRVA